jgi:hypothetical protein
MLGGT